MNNAWKHPPQIRRERRRGAVWFALVFLGLLIGLTAALPAIGDAITANTIHPDCRGDSRC